MEFLSGLIAFVVVCIPLSVIIFVVWFIISPPPRGSLPPNSNLGKSSPITDDDEDDWEGQIRHDPYHPGGSPGAGHGGGGRW